MIDAVLKERYLKAKRALFDKVYSQRLNPEQCRAVFTVKGPLLVLAGAGSGKTTVLVNRICFLIKYGDAYFSEAVPDSICEEGVQALEDALKFDCEEIETILPEFIHDPAEPWRVLAFTFTNKAAREIKERLLSTFDDESIANSIWAGTFHSICMRILRLYADRLGYQSGFSIYDTDDQKRLISQCMKELAIDEKTLNGRTVCENISRAKEKLQGPEEFEITRDPRSKNIQRIYALYQQKMLSNNAMDFDDIIMNTVLLLADFPDLREYYQKKFRFVLVDEYQDTNYAQFVLIKYLSDGYRNLMVVGDDDQSIYRFRGATVENILKFDKSYSDATVIKLEQNYRSTETILDAANAVIANNSSRHRKHLWSENGKGEKIIVHEAPTQTDEGKYILSKITDAVRRGEHKYSDFAVLYRINEMARSLEQSFAKSAIPYRVLGAQRFTDRKEIRDIIAYLYTVMSGHDNQRLMRIINEPKRKIGQSTVEAVGEIARMNGLSMFDVISRAYDFPILSKVSDKLLGFSEMIFALRALKLKPSELIPEVFEKTGYKAMLVAEGFEGETRIQHIEEFVSAAVEYEERCEDTSTEPTLQGFLEEIALVSDVDKYDDEADAVVLMTVHSAKGLEFPVVFLAGMEEGIFPSLNNLTSPEELQEERRLCYVAITRAKKKLYITHAKTRMLYGRTTANPLSPFIRREVPTQLLQMDGAKKIPPRAPYPSYPSRDTGSPYASRGSGASSYEGTSSYQRPSYPSERNGTPYGMSTPGSERTYPTRNTQGAASSAPGRKAPSTPETYGVKEFPVGTRVQHSIFGDGTILASKVIGGDILFTVKFDTSGEKRLMATYAKLKEIK